jgi:hypothetical protein
VRVVACRCCIRSFVALSEPPQHESRVQAPPAARLDGLDPRTQLPQLPLQSLVLLDEVVGLLHGHGL